MNENTILEITYTAGDEIHIKLNMTKLLTYTDEQIHSIATHESAHLYYNIERMVLDARKQLELKSEK
jgi:predicted SprT family Zn-dependent metalloprotease